MLQAALLRRTAPAFVFEAYCDARLARASDVYGLLPAHHDLGALIARAMPTTMETA